MPEPLLEPAGPMAERCLSLSWWWACESRRGRSRRGSGRCSGLSVALHLCRTTARVYLDDLRARGDVYAVVGEAPQRAADRCAKDSAACLGDHVSAGHEVADAQRRAEDAARGRVDVAVTAMPVYLPWLTRKVE